MNMFVFTGKPLSILYIYEEVANITTPTTLFLSLHIFHFCFLYENFFEPKEGFYKCSSLQVELELGYTL